MNYRRSFFRLLFVGWLWTLAANLLLSTHFFFAPFFEYEASPDLVFKGLLFIAGLCLLITPLCRSAKGAAAANLLVLGFFLATEGRAGHWVTILPEFRYCWDLWSNELFGAGQCLIFPDTFYCNPRLATPLSSMLPLPLSYILTVAVDLAMAVGLHRFKRWCFPDEKARPKADSSACQGEVSAETSAGAPGCGENEGAASRKGD